MPNGRCKVHGGKSTGPRTPEGLERSRRANWKHGYYSREAKAERSRVRAGILKEYFVNQRSRADQVPNAQALLTKRRTRHPWFLRLLLSIGLSSTLAWISSAIRMA